MGFGEVDKAPWNFMLELHDWILALEPQALGPESRVRVLNRGFWLLDFEPMRLDCSDAGSWRLNPEF